MEEIRVHQLINQEIQKIRKELELALQEPKKTKRYQIEKENSEAREEIRQEIEKSEEVKLLIDECEDGLVEYHDMLRFNRENHEKQLEKMKELNQTYAETIENERKSMMNKSENEVLKTELNSLIDQRNYLLTQIHLTENEKLLKEEKEENDLKQYISHLNSQLNLITNNPQKSSATLH